MNQHGRRKSLHSLEAGKTGAQNCQRIWAIDHATALAVESSHRPQTLIARRLPPSSPGFDCDHLWGNVHPQPDIPSFSVPGRWSGASAVVRYLDMQFKYTTGLLSVKAGEISLETFWVCMIPSRIFAKECEFDNL
jgi:hypothetical protein